MRALRLAFLRFEPSFTVDETFKSLLIENVHVRTDAIWKDEHGSISHHLVVAEFDIDRPLDRDSAGLIVVPRELLRAAEAAIERVANLVAVAGCRKRSIGSPQAVSLVLLPQNENEVSWLRESSGFEKGNQLILAVRRYYQFKLDDVTLSVLQDRLDGVQLLAEALSHDHATGRFHDLLRFFERSFAQRSGLLVKPLGQFLQGADQNYTTREIQHWIERGPLTHADRRPDFLIESDVRPLIDRMEFGAYDILLHKDSWRSPSPTRRTLERPKDAVGAWPLDDLRRGFTVLDPYGTWPIDLLAPEVHVRRGWWVKRAPGEVQINHIDPFEPLSYSLSADS